MDENEDLLVKVGISYVSTGNARLNLNTEIPDWDFNKIKRDAVDKWEKRLSRIIVEDSNTENPHKVLYSNLSYINSSEYYK